MLEKEIYNEMNPYNKINFDDNDDKEGNTEAGEATVLPNKKGDSDVKGAAVLPSEETETVGIEKSDDFNESSKNSSEMGIVNYFEA